MLSLFSHKNLDMHCFLNCHNNKQMSFQLANIFFMDTGQWMMNVLLNTISVYLLH